jgi:hypothetical protein
MVLNIFQAADSNFYAARRFSEWKHQYRILRSQQNCHAGAVWNGYIQQLHMALSAVLSERRVDSRTRITGLSDFSRVFAHPAKAQQHRQYIPRRVQIIHQGSNRGLMKVEKSDAEHFAGSPQQMRIQLNLRTYVPELNIRGRTRG